MYIIIQTGVTIIAVSGSKNVFAIRPKIKLEILPNVLLNINFTTKE